ncbi:hypothetical protein [Streptomyces sp. NPDC001667]
MSELLSDCQQRDLLDDARRCGLTDPRVLALVTHSWRLLLLGQQPVPGRPPLWALPSTAIRPGELIRDALDRLVCQDLRFRQAAQARYLGFAGDYPSGTAQFLFGLDNSGQPRPTGVSGTGQNLWWHPQDTRPLDIAPASRTALETLYRLPPPATHLPGYRLRRGDRPHQW